MEPNRIICTHRPSHCHSARIFSWSTPSCVYIYEIFHGQGFSVVKEVQSTLWGIPVRLSSGWVCEVHECRLLQLRLNAVVHFDAFASRLQRYEKKAVAAKLFMAYFLFRKARFFDSFDKLSFFAYISMINNILFLFTRAMIFFLHEKWVFGSLFFISNLPYSCHMVGFLYAKVKLFGKLYHQLFYITVIWNNLNSHV